MSIRKSVLGTAVGLALGAAVMNIAVADVMVGGSAMLPARNIVQNAVNSADHTTLVAAVKAAGLVDTLQGEGPFTVFAPVNAAFAALPAGTVDHLLMPASKDALTKVLTYHVVPGELAPDQLAGTHKTLEGADLTVAGTGMDFTANGDSKVVCGNVQTANATVYIVDTVLMPAS